MAVTNKMYKQFYAGLLNKEVDIDTDTIKLALLKGTYTPDLKQDDFFNDVSAFESTSSDYTAGGSVIGSVSITASTANFDIVVDGNDVTWSNATISARYGVVYAANTTATTTQRLICLVDFGTTESSNNGNFTVQWGSSGIFKITVSS